MVGSELGNFINVRMIKEVGTAGGNWMQGTSMLMTNLLEWRLNLRVIDGNWEW